MSHPKTGCLICGKDLEYFEPPRRMKCEICGADFESEAACLDGHFICDDCHRQDGYAVISKFAQTAAETDPLAIARRMMSDSQINMHGPEHHYLVVAALLAAYKNAGGSLDFGKSLALARQRAQKVPGGICGHWGCCGAAVASGIFVSLITGATPLSVQEWSLANQMTSLSLQAIAANGGPRCCKRNSYLAILTAAKYVKEHFQLDLAATEQPPSCSFFGGNPSCKKEACLFFPGSEGKPGAQSAFRL